MDHFLASNNYLVPCPNWLTNLTDDLGYPSTTTLFGVEFMVGLACVLYIAIKRNKFIFEGTQSIELQEAKAIGTSISDNTISNNYWIGYMLFVSLWAFSNLLKFSLEKVMTPVWQLIFSIVPEILSCCMALFLALSLNHQRIYRSYIAPRMDESRTSSNYFSSGNFSPSSSGLMDSESLASSSHSSYSTRTDDSNSYNGRDEYIQEEDAADSTEGRCSCRAIKATLTEYVVTILNREDLPFWILFVLGLLCIYIEFSVVNTPFDVFFWPFYLIFVFIQRVPVIILTVIIITNANISEGPAILSRVVLVIAVSIILFADYPLVVWARLFHDLNCSLFGVAGLADLMTIFKIVSLPLFLVFISKEYTRNQNEIRWRFQAEVETKHTTDYQWQNFGSRYSGYQ